MRWAYRSYLEFRSEEYGLVANLANPSSYMYILKGFREVIAT